MDARTVRETVKNIRKQTTANEYCKTISINETASRECLEQEQQKSKHSIAHERTSTRKEDNVGRAEGLSGTDSGIK